MQLTRPAVALTLAACREAMHAALHTTVCQEPHAGSNCFIVMPLRP